MAPRPSPSDVAGPWPRTPDELIHVQRRLAVQSPGIWHASNPPVRVGACFVCFPRGFKGPGAAGDRAWAAAVVTIGTRVLSQSVVQGEAPASYHSGLLALREGPLLEDAVRALSELPDVLLVDATGRDHPRRAGLALHLGAVVDIPSIGVTDRPLVATGTAPPNERGASSPLRVEDEIVGYWVCAVQGARPLAVHAGWRTDPQTAVEIVLSTTAKVRTPEPLRHARQIAREARAHAVPV